MTYPTQSFRRLAIFGAIALAMSLPGFAQPPAPESGQPAQPVPAAQPGQPGQPGQGRRGPGGPGGQAARPAPPPVTSIIYTMDESSKSTIQDRDPGYRPVYLVYADKQRTADEAKKLLDDLGLTQFVQQWHSRAWVIAPKNGTAYDATADVTEYQNFLRMARSSNLKIVAVGDGATFVNNVIAKHAFSVAGILTYGGSTEAGGADTMPVPAYVHSSNAAIGKEYVQANGATAKTNAKTWTMYSNPSQQLQRVVVSKLDDSKETMAQAFQNAWTTVFSRNYRLFMKLKEPFAPGFDPNDYTDPWELEPYVMYDELGMKYEAVVEDLADYGPTLRYDYVPKTAEKAPAKSVPLVVMMHGNMNDPRIQGESTGWPEVAAKNNIILVSIEWQGRTTTEKLVFKPLGEKGTMMVLDRVLEKYPQIDPSRVYLTGLSAGAMNSLNFGLDNIGRIAAVEASSAPFGPPQLMDAAAKLKGQGKYLPVYSIAGDHDMYKPLPVNDSARSFYNVIRAYAEVDDITVPEKPDMSVNPMFGLKLDGQRMEDLGGTQALVGTLSNKDGVMIKLTALEPYGHWNYKPAAPDMWAFLSRYRRDLTTGKLIVGK